MSILERPDSVLEEQNVYKGHNCVACVAAVLYNETRNSGFATANRVAMQWNIAPNTHLPPSRAMMIIHQFTGLTASPGRHKPWDNNSPEGHYAIFCLGRRHVIYGRRNYNGEYYLYDPQTEKDQNYSSLLQNGYAPFESYHLA